MTPRQPGIIDETSATSFASWFWGFAPADPPADSAPTSAQQHAELVGGVIAGEGLERLNLGIQLAPLRFGQLELVVLGRFLDDIFDALVRFRVRPAAKPGHLQDLPAA